MESSFDLDPSDFYYGHEHWFNCVPLHTETIQFGKKHICTPADEQMPFLIGDFKNSHTKNVLA